MLAGAYMLAHGAEEALPAKRRRPFAGSTLASIAPIKGLGASAHFAPSRRGGVRKRPACGEVPARMSG